MNLLPFEKLDRNIVIKREATTDENYGCWPEKRPIKELLNRGVICLNKPAGPTSHQIVDYVKKILPVKKASHGGTLDPKVTGVLPIMLNKSVRLAEFLLKAGKEYIALMHLHKDISIEELKKSASSFVGKIKQLPPLRSAVKRKLREREIYYLEILEKADKDVLLRIGCQAGFYVRKFIHDWGKQLGIGAHMAQLIRTKAGPFNDSFWTTLQEIKDAYDHWKETKQESWLRKVILPYEIAIQHLPKIWIIDSAVNSICHGADLKLPGIAKFENCIEKNDYVAILTLKNELVAIGIAKASKEELQKKEKGLAAKTKKVLMERNTYPKIR